MVSFLTTMLRISIFLMILCAPAIAQSTEYVCKVEKKYNYEHEYTSSEIRKWQFSLIIDEKGSNAYISRCSFSPSEQKVTCDKYEADKVEYDERIKIKKYYFFSSQFDVQLFQDLTFIENNGRGDIAYGKCKFVAP